MSQITIKSSGEVIILEKSSISMDIEQFVWNLNTEVATKDLLQKLLPPANLGQNYIPVFFTLGGAVWDLIIEESNCNDSSYAYTVTGKSKAIILAEPYALQITKTWLDTTAQAICAELCSASGITLDWQIVDWPIVYYQADKRYPIDIINEIVRDIGAKLQSLPNGTLTVVYYPALNPADLSTATALYSLDTLRNVFERAEKFINRENFNCVFVTKDASLLEAPQLSIEEINDGDISILKVFCNPSVSAAVLNLQQHSGSNATLLYQAPGTDRITEDVLIDAGEGKLTKQFENLVSVKWQQEEIGALTIAENGRIECDHGGLGLATITYDTTYLKYKLTRIGRIEKTLLTSDELPKPVLTTGTRPAPPVIVKTLSTSAALTARSNAELWAQYDSKEYQLAVAFTGTVFLCGKMAKLNVIKESLGFNAWVKSVAIDSSGGEITQSVTLERPVY